MIWKSFFFAFAVKQISTGCLTLNEFQNDLEKLCLCLCFQTKFQQVEISKQQVV